MHCSPASEGPKLQRVSSCMLRFDHRGGVVAGLPAGSSSSLSAVGYLLAVVTHRRTKGQGQGRRAHTCELHEGANYLAEHGRSADLDPPRRRLESAAAGVVERAAITDAGSLKAKVYRRADGWRAFACQSPKVVGVERVASFASEECPTNQGPTIDQAANRLKPPTRAIDKDDGGFRLHMLG